MAIDAFLKLDSITGESTDANHAGEIHIKEWSWEMSNTSSVSHGTGIATGKVQVGELCIKKDTDSSTAALITSITLGKHIKNGKLTLRKATGTAGGQLDYLTLEMNDVWVTGFDQDMSDEEEGLTESVKLAFVGFQLTYTQQKNDGSAGTKYPVGYNLKKNNTDWQSV